MLLKSSVLSSPILGPYLRLRVGSVTLARPCCSRGLSFPICAMENGLGGLPGPAASLPMCRWALLPTPVLPPPALGNMTAKGLRPEAG